MNKDQTKAALDALDEPPHPSCPCVVGVLLGKRIRELEEENMQWAKEVSRLREELNTQDTEITQLRAVIESQLEGE